MRKLLFSLLAVVLVAVAVVGATSAYFSDSATSEVNTFSTGTLNMALTGGTQNGDDVIGTWVSPAAWAPGQSVSATLEVTNKGTIDSHHIYFYLQNLQHNSNGDTSNMMNAIIITSLTERFNSVTTGNQVAILATQVGDGHAPLTLAEFVSATYYTYDDQSGDGVVIGGGNLNDYSITLGLTFDSAAGNDYQGDSCSFDMKLVATQNSDTTGMISLH